MERSDFRLIEPSRELARGRPRGRGASLWAGVTILTVGLAATLLGADRERRPLPARELAEAALARSLERGVDDPEVTDALIQLRRWLGLVPLDSRTRVVYASLLLGVSRDLSDTHAAVFHASRALELAPVTLSVVRPAVLVLARSGESRTALTWTHRMFGYDAPAAAELLTHVEPLLVGEQVESGIPDRPEAQVAWFDRLVLERRQDDAERCLRQAYSRWPDHLPTLARLAEWATRNAGTSELRDLFPDDREIPDDREAAPVLLYRALYRAGLGEREAAREDLERALRLDGSSRSVGILAGEAYEALDAYEEARRSWDRALFELAPEEVATRQYLLYRLARLEDRHGQPAAALHYWETLLELSPEHSEARRRLDDLSGFRREP